MAVSLEDFARAARNHSDDFTSGVLTANQITSLVGQNSAKRNSWETFGQAQF